MSESSALSRVAHGVQVDLIPVEQLEDGFWKKDEKNGRYTAKRFFAKRPQDYQRCIELLGAGMGLLRIASLLKVHHLTVAAVRDSEGEAVDISKQRIRKNFRLGLEVASERLPEVMAHLSPGQLPVAAAILADKLRDMDGEPTQRVEVTINGKLTHEAVLAELESFPPAIDIATLPPMGERAGEVAAKEGAIRGDGDSKSPETHT